ncbi:hypothetical protein NG798_19350 [Ancylothrix sp. C2]|nr:hypothetical protein [Ancylothrix sp. D3o]
MLEKVILATTLTFLLNLFLALSVPSSVSKTNLRLNWLPEQTPHKPAQLADNPKASQIF